jgi:hypothetical protein
MKKALVLAMALAVVMVLVVLSAQTFTYVGAAKCVICHKTEKQGQQHPIWEASKHSKSLGALTSPEAAANAQAMGVANPPEDAKCLTCHAPLFDKAAELKAEGVTCEVCHGPGSEYKKLSVMKSREESAKNGLVLLNGADEIKAFCLKCHANAHGKNFDFAASWDKIKHPVPGK